MSQHDEIINDKWALAHARRWQIEECEQQMRFLVRLYRLHLSIEFSHHMSAYYGHKHEQYSAMLVLLRSTARYKE